jgi:putative ABC transport system permease protein
VKPAAPRERLPCMPAHPTALLQSFAGDVRFALRYFSRHRATTVIIVAVLTLATAANTLIFSIFQGQFLRPAPQVPQDPAHAIVRMQERPTPTASWDLIGLNGTQLRQLAERRETFAAIAAWVEHYAILAGGDSAGARNAPVTFVTPNFFTTLGVPISPGRDLRPETDGSLTADLSAVMAEISAGQLFGSPERALGKRLLVNQVPVEIVGIAPRQFRGATRDDVEPVLFMPMSARSGLIGFPERWMDDESSRSLSIFARLAAGASFEQATAVAQQVAIATLPDSADRVGMTRMADVRHLGAVPPWEKGIEYIVGYTLIGSLGLLILLVGWMNVSSLMVAAAVARRQEIAVRLALGASRFRIIRQLVTESTIISIVGATGGAIVAFWLLSMMSASDLNGANPTPDVGTFAFVFALAIATGILFGLSPALHATQGVAGAIRDSGQGATRKSRLQRNLVVAQIALSQPLLVMLLILLRMVVADYKPIAPETSREVIGVTFKPNLDPRQAALGPQLVQDLIPRIASRPEVHAVVPAASAGFDVRGVHVPDREGRIAAGDAVPTVLHLEGAAPGWFGVLDVPILLGRDVMLADTASTDRPVVIGADLAQALYGDANPVGQVLYSPPLTGQDQDSIAMSVVGVYDSRVKVPGMATAGTTPGASVAYRVYTAHGKAWQKNGLLIRTRGPAAGALPDLQRFAIAEAPQLPISSIKTLQQIDEQELRVTVRVSLLAGLGGLIALTIAALGLYGVVALSVRQRTREIGIRIAVGAEPMRVARMFLASGMKSAVIALAIGLPVTIGVLQVLVSQGEMRMSPTLPMLVGVVIAGVLLAVAAIATWIPARRAAQVDPGLTLRAE